MVEPPPTREITSLSGTYRVKAPAILSDAACCDALRQLEEQGRIPFRSIADSGRPGTTDLRMSAGSAEVTVAGWRCQAIIFGKLVGLVPREKVGADETLDEAERIVAEVGHPKK